MTIRRNTRELLRRAQELLGHELSPGDVDAVLNQVLRHFVEHRERRKFGRTDRPQSAARTRKSDSRNIPAEVRRAVAERDGGRCTYTSATGKRCDATMALEYDHIVPFARGGSATARNLRLRCRTHNQFEAEQAYGAEFMRLKRTQTRVPATTTTADGPQAEPDPDLDVRPWLRSLGIRAGDAERAAEHCASLADATLEERVKAALSFLVPPHRRPVTSHLRVGPRAEEVSAA